MTTCIQGNPCQSTLCALGLPQLRRQPFTRCVLPVRVNCFSAKSSTLPTSSSIIQQCGPTLKSQQCGAAIKCQQLTTVCLFGGKDESERNNGESPWKSFQKAFGGFKGESVENLLREQIKTQEFYSADSGKNPPRGGSGGGGGSGRDDFGDSEDGGFSEIVDETIQVTLATLGFIFLYIYIITGEELTRLWKDYIKFLFSGTKSVRLKRVMYKWKRFCQKLTEKKEFDKFWLEKTILNTTTVYDSPEKYRRILRPYLASNSNQE
ncbi:hypothetical protein K2173_017228 [Erythroxylum novogranatense]|uniref:Uncharacterized protein n=1 Tax=Erythroxylum novogranatense TaxID=1862640 RepID=A0AAV8U637_9ROSI|nr:hypothetical protein K2173_017228 [Erythroxylum novogranatense]